MLISFTAAGMIARPLAKDQPPALSKSAELFHLKSHRAHSWPIIDLPTAGHAYARATGSATMVATGLGSTLVDVTMTGFETSVARTIA